LFENIHLEVEMLIFLGFPGFGI